MKIILNNNILGLGKAGDIISVKNGYARNYLIPKGSAKLATRNNIIAIQKAIAIQEKKDAMTRKNLESLAKQLDKLSLKFDLKSGEEDRLFGSLTSQMIVDAIADKGFNITKKEVVLKEPIKHIGKYFVDINLGNELVAKIKIKISAKK